MADLVANQHVVQLVAHVLPNREDEDTVLDIERSRGGLVSVFNHNILSCQEAAQDVLLNS